MAKTIKNAMKSLFLVQKNQRIDLDSYYQAIADKLENCEVRWLNSGDQDDLRSYFFANVNLSEFDRVILFVRFKKEIKQVDFISSLPGLFIIEHDACQNYIPGKYRGKFSEYYEGIAPVSVLTSGFGVTQKLRGEGVDAHFVPKGYDDSLLRDKHFSRDIELGFLGSTKHKIYAGRKKALEIISKKEGLIIARTKSGEEYCDMLCRIKFFVSADVGLGEYMVKTFEAMACGCVLFTWDQGERENLALGFRDLENVVLFASMQEFHDKLELLRGDDRLSERIASAGKSLVENGYSWRAQGARVAEVIEQCSGEGAGIVEAKQKKALVIIPYFGRWPKWINVFMASCQVNDDFDWLVLTDCGPVDFPPGNVNFVDCTFKEYCEFVSRRLGIKFVPESPYKLCDIKPALGFIHQDYLEGYDYWAWSDLDLVYGDLSKYYAPYLGRYNLISNHATRVSGHFCLLRTGKKYLEAFKKIPEWEICFESGQHLAVDEKQFSRLFLRGKNFPVWLRWAFRLFRPMSWKALFHEAYSTPNCRIAWHNGASSFPKSWFWRKDKGLFNDEDEKKSFPYFHFLVWKKSWLESNIEIEKFSPLGHSEETIVFSEAGISLGGGQDEK
ncbi:MAG: glycosyltransferase [Porticoccaceae bacterium]